MVAPLPLIEELALSSELKAVVRRMDGYIAKLRLYKSCDDTLGTIEMLSRMQLDDMEKAARLLLMARETQVKLDEKTGFIMRMRNRVFFVVISSTSSDVYTSITFHVLGTDKLLKNPDTSHNNKVVGSRNSPTMAANRTEEDIRGCNLSSANAEGEKTIKFFIKDEENAGKK
ncbi:hypothetical protein Tco_0986428 [Tanacetum coccineum]